MEPDGGHRGCSKMKERKRKCEKDRGRGEPEPELGEEREETDGGVRTVQGCSAHRGRTDRNKNIKLTVTTM